MGGFLALFWATAAALYRILAARGPLRVLLFVGLLALAEWLRGHILTGFPWDLPGEAWRAGSAPSQGAALIGAYGLTWVTVLIAVAPFALLDGPRGRRFALVSPVLLLALYGYGAWRLATEPRAGPSGPWIRIVQADVRQESKYDARIYSSIVSRYVALTASPPPPAAHGRRADIVVWPEGAIPAAFEDYLSDRTWTYGVIVRALAPGQTLILGGYRFGAAANDAPIAFNSLLALRRDGSGLRPLGLYDKYRLVPFGEFMPFDSIVTRWGIKQFVHVGDGFTAGPRPRPLRLDGSPPVQPLICYESLFPGFTREGAAASGFRPSWIVNISNDAWFGPGEGPRQHLNLASYRAIEEGLPMVRATPTGISAMIDAYGRSPAASRLKSGAYGVIDTRLPAARPPTPYETYGDAPFFLLLALSVSGAALPRRRLARA
jgi:apolipoprotein N-acyltransferase